MALYTGKGDDGTTYFFGSKERFGKDTPLVEALGTCDELCSLLGYLRARFQGSTLRLDSQGQTLGSDSEILEEVQQNIFIIQAELAGADKQIVKEKVRAMEERINNIEKELPSITTFFVPGANEISALFDLARTVARRAERRVVALETMFSNEIRKPGFRISKWSLAYLNRLSSLLYALARLHAQKEGKVEKKPHYK